MDKFNFQDFERNPKKYELFKTATVRNTMVHQDGETKEGTIVGIRFATETPSKSKGFHPTKNLEVLTFGMDTTYDITGGLASSHDVEPF